MAGLIQSNAPGLTLTPVSVMAQLHLNPQQKTQLQRIVVAGMKVMFAPQTHQLMLQQLQGPGPMAQKLGQGIAGLMGLLLRESKNSIPKQLLIPAGMVLLAHAADFVRQAGQPVTDTDISQGIKLMIQTVLQQAKLDPAKVQAAGARGAGMTGASSAPPAAPAAAAAQPSQVE